MVRREDFTHTGKNPPIEVERMTEPNYVQLFHETTGGCWHEWDGLIPYKCSCGYKYTSRGGIIHHIHSHPNPTYDNSADILKRMREYCGEERYFEFIKYAVLRYEKSKYYTTSVGCVVAFIENYCFNAPALLRKAVEFLKGGDINGL